MSCGTKTLVFTGAGLSVIGAVLVFALADPKPFFGLSPRGLGGVILVTGLLLLAAAGVRESLGPSTDKPDRTPRAQAFQAVAGLLAVLIGILAVAVIGVVTLSVLLTASTKSESAVAIATSAFGVISALVGAYLGVKIGTQQSGNLADEAQSARAEAATLQAWVPPENKERAARDVENSRPPRGSGRAGG